MYKLLIISKISQKEEYANGFGSQFDINHVVSVAERIKSPYLKIDIVDYKKVPFDYNLYIYRKKYNGIFFIGISEELLKKIKFFKKNDLYLWGFNWITWINHRELLSEFSIIFEQAFKDLKFLKHDQQQVIYTPLAFQDNISIHTSIKKVHQLGFFGTLNRGNRNSNKDYRTKVICGLLEKGINVTIFNGRSSHETEHEYLEELKKYNNFSLINSFGSPREYSECEYVLNLPFHRYGSTENIDWGMSSDEIENSIWLIHWDVFKCIGTKSNIITYKCDAINNLGLNNTNANFYLNNPSNINGIVEEVYQIIQKKESKIIDEVTWKKNTYYERWKEMLSKIEEFKTGKLSR